MNIKRKIDSYEIIHAIQVGNREVVLGIDENNPAGLYYMCGFLYKQDQAGPSPLQSE